VEEAESGLVLPAVIQRQYDHFAFEVAVMFVPVACPGCTALVWRELTAGPPYAV